MVKKCKRCSLERKKSEFSISSANKDGLNSWCKVCKKEYSRIKNINRVKLDITSKFCSRCESERDIIEFSKGSDSDGFNKWCKCCQNEYSKNYYKENIDTLKPIREDYKNKNKEKIKKYNRNRYLEIDKNKMSENYYLNKNYIKEKRDAYRKSDSYKEWYKNYRVNNAWRFRYRGVLRGVMDRVKSGKNGKKTKEILGYSDLEFKRHIENLFCENMSWSTKDMEIDHIIPVVAFKPDCPLYIINSLDNLRPLYKTDNMKKFTSIDFSYIKLYEKYIDYLVDGYRIKILEYV